MPFSGGTAGVHTDDMHQGDAKRDVKNGVAGLDADGHVLGKGWGLKLPRSGTDIIMFYDRTSGEYAGYFKRIGANDWEMWVSVAGVDARVLNFADFGEANGACRLDSNAFVRPEQVAFMIESYDNHTGSVDNFLETLVSGNGEVTTSVVNHGMNMTSGITNPGYAVYRTKKDWVLGAKPLTGNFILQSIVAGTDNKHSAYHGFKAAHEVHAIANHLVFFQNYLGAWSVTTADASSQAVTNIAAVADGDVLSISASSSEIRYFVNGVLVATHTSSIPTVAMNFGNSVHAYDWTAAVGRSFSVDYMAVRRYV